MEQEVKIELTKDGSHTLFVPTLNEHYHSVNGAKQESDHIFIKAGLLHSSKNDIKILEIGFGTGLNAYLSLCVTQDTNKRIDYTSLELYPLPMEIIRQLNYVESDKSEIKEYYIQLHACDWDIKNEITPHFYLTKIRTDFSKLDSSFLSDITFDIVYFDAFAPEKQPEMWSQEIFDTLYTLTSEDGILTTYCAKGVVRRMLLRAGYNVERLPGPPGKREMLRATKSKI